jgi:hypothetical protein
LFTHQFNTFNLNKVAHLHKWFVRRIRTCGKEILNYKTLQFFIHEFLDSEHFKNESEQWGKFAFTLFIYLFIYCLFIYSLFIYLFIYYLFIYLEFFFYRLLYLYVRFLRWSNHAEAATILLNDFFSVARSKSNEIVLDGDLHFQTMSETNEKINKN